MADFDGDGRDDLYTGCFDGGMYVLAGQGAGKFAPPTAMVDKSGSPLRLGQFWHHEESRWSAAAGAKFPAEIGIAGAAVDWDADGDLDLILGSYAGNFYLRSNLGSAKSPAFATDSTPIEVAGVLLSAGGPHAMPTVADWDGDGRFDLLSGCDDGAVRLWLNLGAPGTPKFGAPTVLVEPSNKASDAPGLRSQVAVCDFDADGRPDLLVGDYRVQKDAAGKNVSHGYVWWYRRLTAP